MAEKGNKSIINPVNLDQLNNRISDARASLRRARDSSSEGAALIYMIHRDCHSGEARKWLNDLIEKFNKSCADNNTKVSSDFDRASKFFAGTLTESDPLRKVDPTTEEKAANEREIDKLRHLHNMPKSKRRDLRMVPADTSIKEGSRRFNAIVKVILEFDREHHSSMVSRYCLVVDWIASQFDDQADYSMEAIKQAIEASDGFFRCAEIQRELVASATEDKNDQQIIAKAIRDLSLSAVKNIQASAVVSMPVAKHVNGYVLVIARANGPDVEILAPADISDGEVERAVKRLGSQHPIPANPAVDFVGEVLRLGEIIKDRVSVPAADGSDVKVKTDRTLTIRADQQGRPFIAVSINRVDAGPVLHAYPKADDVISLSRGEAVMQGYVRRRLEQQIADEGRRALYSLKLDTDPQTESGKPSTNAFVWELTNQALEEKARPTATMPMAFVRLQNVTDKPLDIDHFSPQFSGELGMEEVNRIYEQLLMPWDQKRRKPAEGAGSGKKGGKSTFTFDLKKTKLVLTCGDADPMIVKFQTKSQEITALHFRIADIHALFQQLKSINCKKVTLEGDTGGLMRFGWTDLHGDFSFYLPTVGTDGKLQSRRIAPMQAAMMPIAAE